MVTPTRLHAQQVDPQRATDAQALFEQAVNEMDAGQIASACKKLEEVTRLVPDGVGGKYVLGECYERLGKLASAWTQFSFAQQVAARLGQTERAEGARAKVETLRPKLATLSVIVPAKMSVVPGISVVRDGVELREPQWGTPLFVDAGQHEVIVTAPGHTTWKKHVEVLTDGVGVKFSIPENAIHPVPQEGERRSASGQLTGSVPNAPDRTWQKPLGMTMVVAGTASLGVGAVLGLMAVQRNKESNESGHCLQALNRCDDVGFALREQAVGYGNASTGLLIAGFVVGLGGVVMWSTMPREKPQSTKKSAYHDAVNIVMTPGGVTVRGRF